MLEKDPVFSPHPQPLIPHRQTNLAFSPAQPPALPQNRSDPASQRWSAAHRPPFLLSFLGFAPPLAARCAHGTHASTAGPNLAATSRPVPVLTPPWPPPLLARAAAHRAVAAPSLAHGARPPPCAATIRRLFRPTGGRRCDVSWVLGRGPGAVSLLPPQVIEEQHLSGWAHSLPLLQASRCSWDAGHPSFGHRRCCSAPLPSALARSPVLSTSFPGLQILVCHISFQVNTATFTSLLLTKLLDVEVM